MSQRKSGREWIPEGPASASAHDPIAVLGRLSTESLIPQGGAGPIERRQANEAMRAAWRREALPDLPAIPSPTRRMAEDELVDAYRNATPAVDAAVEEEPDMDEPARPVPDNPLTRLAAAAVEAAEAVEAFEAARIRRTASVDALRSAWDALGLVTEPAATSTNGATNIPRTIPVVAPKPSTRRRPGGDAERGETVEARGQRVLEVLARHGGNTKAAGDELGMRGNVVARIAVAARAREQKAS